MTSLLLLKKLSLAQNPVSYKKPECISALETPFIFPIIDGRSVPVGENVSGVNETVEHFRCLLNEVALVGVVLEVIVRLEVEDHVEGLPVVWNLLVQSSQVELVL